MNTNEEKKQSIDLALENLTSILPLMTKNFSKVLRTKTNFTPHTLYTLGALIHHGKLTMSGIGCHLSIPKPHVTGVVDKMISEKLVERLNDPNDRRIIYIRITPLGEKVFLDIKRQIGEEMREKLMQLSDDQVEQLVVSSKHVRDVLVDLFRQQLATDAACGCKSETI
jgi:DNA-binding MarR family transcriptional regulator